jgi:hypothetical protein
VTYRGNRAHESRSIICRRNDGSFYSLEERTLYVNGVPVARDSRERGGYDPAPPYITPGERPGYPRPYEEENRWRRRREYRPSCDGWNQEVVRFGETVYTRYGQTGTFQGFGRNGREVSINVNGYIQILNLSDLALPGCHFGMRTGQVVSTRYGQQGVVAGIFSNGDVAVKTIYYIQILRRDDLFY